MEGAEVSAFDVLPNRDTAFPWVVLERNQLINEGQRGVEEGEVTQTKEILHPGAAKPSSNSSQALQTLIPYAVTCLSRGEHCCLLPTAPPCLSPGRVACTHRLPSLRFCFLFKCCRRRQTLCIREASTVQRNSSKARAPAACGQSCWVSSP